MRAFFFFFFLKHTTSNLRPRVAGGMLEKQVEDAVGDDENVVFEPLISAIRIVLSQPAMQKKKKKRIGPLTVTKTIICSNTIKY